MQKLFFEICRMSLTASGVILLVLLVRLGLKRAPKIYSYALWSVVLVRLLLPVGIPISGLPQMELLQLPVLEIQAEPAPNAPPEGLEPTVRPELVDEMKPQREKQPERIPLDLRQVLPAVWMSGAAGILLYGLFSYCRFKRHLLGAVKVDRNIYAVDHIGAAYVVGILRPRIYVDSGLPADQLPYILAHEQTHIRRLDPMTRGLAFLALSLYWFNPLVWLAFFLSGRDMEMSCDEAVISRMGARVRGPYAQSLLTLATGQRLRLGSPIAFGEGSTGGRVRNLSRWKQVGRGIRILCGAVTAAAVAFCLCDPVSVEARATEPGNGPEQGREIETSIKLFENQEKTVKFVWNLQSVTEPQTMPIVEVEPHFPSAEEIQKVVYPFYGDVPIYDLGVQGERRYSRVEIKEKIHFLSSYLTEESRKDLHLPGDNAADPALIPKELAAYEAMLESAPEKIPHELWDGTLEDQPWLDEYHRVLNLFGYIEEPYNLSVSQDSYRGQVWNSIDIQQTDGGGWETARYIKDSLLYYGKKPSETQAREYASWAQDALNQVNPGQWKAEKVQVMDMGDNQGWAEVRFSGMIQGLPMLSEQQSLYFERAELPGLLDVGLPHASASYAGDQTLISMHMGDFLKEIQVVDAKPPLLSLDKLMEAAEKQLRAYDARVLVPENDISLEDLEVTVDITGIRYGLGLEKQANQYLAVPAAQILGTVRCFRDGKLLADSADNGDFIMTLNAVDGKVIG